MLSTYQNSELEKLKEKLNEMLALSEELQLFMKFVETAESSRALDKKTKELISLAIGVVIRCEPCIMWHMEECYKAGASFEEVLDALKTAVVMGGGPALAYGVKAYELAKKYYGK
ncbi:carboxymuconolactone decarboxylase family protein [Thermosphaera chiliense]|uniref:carboxymuconolactone decarboxylase family protein n=1 Tax=Thermosphaera chiliense TaxID=3402707 RepID=UPI0039B55390